MFKRSSDINNSSTMGNILQKIILCLKSFVQSYVCSIALVKFISARHFNIWPDIVWCLAVISSPVHTQRTVHKATEHH